MVGLLKDKVKTGLLHLWKNIFIFFLKYSKLKICV